MELRNGKYFIQDLPVEDICSKYGLPLFVYDADVITRQYNQLKDAFSVPNLTLNYACKALSNISILRHMKRLGAGIDTVSVGEIRLALQAGFSPKQIVFTPSSISIQEYMEAVDLGVRINIDNLETLAYFGEHMPDLAVCVRINPHIMAGGNMKISVGHIDSKFGISIHQIDKITQIREQYHMHIEGVHMHTGSDILDVQVFLQATDILFHAAEEFPDLAYIDFGSGFKVKYKPEDVETDISLFGREMSKKFNAFCAETGQDLELMFEPGKFLVSESGYFLAKTNVVKRTPSNAFVGLDSGFNHLIRPMFYDSYHGVINVSNPHGPEKIYSLVGYICETDTFAWNRPVPEVSVGDIIAFRNAGAYCYMMSSNYNTRCRPPEVLIYEGKDYLIRERESFEDLVRLQPDPQLM